MGCQLPNKVLLAIGVGPPVVLCGATGLRIWAGCGWLRKIAFDQISHSPRNGDALMNTIHCFRHLAHQAILQRTHPDDAGIRPRDEENMGVAALHSSSTSSEEEAEVPESHDVAPIAKPNPRRKKKYVEGSWIKTDLVDLSLGAIGCFPCETPFRNLHQAKQRRR